MHFSSITLLLASALATGITASPILEAREVSDYVHHFSEPGKTGGTLSYYGPANGTETAEPETSGLQERKYCPKNKAPNCSSSHAARNNICDQLVTELQADSSVGVEEKPRQICYQGNAEKNTYCCVSWHNAVKGLTKGDLANYAAPSKSIFLHILSTFLLKQTNSV